MKKRGQIFLVLSLAALLASPARADLAVDFSSTIDQYNETNGSYSLGFQFTTNTAITIKSLGFYDYNKDGLTQDHDVGIYDATGNLLVFTTVLTTDPPVSFFRFHDITPYTLSSGQTYYIMAVSGSEKYAYFTEEFTVDSSLTYVTDVWYWDFKLDPQRPQQTKKLTFPNGSSETTQAQGGAYFGPNFSTDYVAPLPGSLFLVVSGLLGLLGVGRRRLR
jgi:hypothetical protein